MNPRRLLCLFAISLCLVLPACERDATQAPVVSGVPEDESAEEFVARVNDEIRAMYPEMTASQWISSTYINQDSQLLAAKGNERWLTALNGWVEQARRFEGQEMSPATARAISLLKLSTSMPAPRDAEKLAELTRIATRMEGMYGAGAYCVEGKTDDCRQLGALEEVLRSSRDYDDQLDAWQGWHSIAQPMREDYVRFVELVNEGARDMGYADAGEMWRSGYDMSPVEIAAEADRLWGQVKPLYEQLHCYARTRLEAQYPDRGSVDGLLPAHLMGNMWQQDWSNLWDILAPYPDAGRLDVSGALQAQYEQGLDQRLAGLEALPTPAERVEIERQAERDIAVRMTRRAEDFYTSLGMPGLPDPFWANSMLIKPRDRDVVCHASAWPMDMADDVRIKMCIEPNEEDFTTVYHELGHIYYYLAYKDQPPLFQAGAHDGFHEAIGDVIVLSMTPEYLASIGLVDAPEQGQAALINAQMRMALSKVAFLPFGLMIDRWRWGVFDGTIAPEQYNKAWWDLKARYQGVAPADPRGEEFFDPGAKYHVPGNTPYTRYFLSHVLQFQLYQALCDASGYDGPLHECSFYGNAAAGEQFWTMLGRGAGQTWQETMGEITGDGRMDGSAILEYFAPLQSWLEAQNEGQSCGWPGGS